MPNDVYYHRIKDAASSFGGGQKTRFSLKNGFDCMMYKYPTLIALELKSNEGTSINFSLDRKKSANIKASQIEGLTIASKYKIKSGLLLNFRKTKTTYYIDISDFNRFTKETTKKSINEKDLIEYGAIVVKQTLKKVRYRYDISFLWDGECK